MFKKRIGITQRVMQHPRYDETMTCLDTRLPNLLVSLGFLPIPLPLLAPDYVAAQWIALNLDGLILSGGNTLAAFADDSDAPESLSPARDACEMKLLDAAIASATPVLGICRGLQMINFYYGGNLVKIKGHAGKGKHKLVATAPDATFSCPAAVNSYHDCAIPANGLAPNLTALARDEEGFIEAFRHQHDNVLAIMWHPERENPPLPSDYKIIREHFTQ